MRACYGTWTAVIMASTALLACTCDHIRAVGAPASAAGIPMEQMLETRYRVWKQWVADHRVEIGTSSRGSDRLYDNEPFRELLALGPRSLPCLATRLDKDAVFGVAFATIAGVRFHVHRAALATGHSLWTVEELPGFEQADAAPDFGAMWPHWWNVDRFDALARFEKLYAERQALVQQGDAKGAQEKLERIQNLGIPVLPLLVGKIDRGATDLVPVMSALTHGGVKPDASAQDCADWWDAHKAEWTLPPAPPEPAK